MMEQYGKAAIVHPTGTGKSYIAFKLIEDNPEKVVIWLSPSEYIFKTQLESLKRNDPEFPLENVHFYTYAKLMCCTQAQLGEIAAQKPAYIILDEFHRAGAECWGESTVALLKLCPDAKLLGLTATNIRYLDNNRDMAEEPSGPGHGTIEAVPAPQAGAMPLLRLRPRRGGSGPEGNPDGRRLPGPAHGRRRIQGV